MELLEIATEIAREAGALLLGRRDEPRTAVASKSSATDMVTDADRASEALIVERLSAARPDDEIVGEEGARRPGGSGLRWTIDPLDGTTNYLFGIPQWSVSIACEDGDRGLVGVVYAPALGELYAGAAGRGATLNGRPIRVGGCEELAEALVGTGFSYRAEERAVAAAMLSRILPAVRDIRRPGSCALDLACTAAARYDGFYEVPTMPWDHLAGVLLVREAGGIVSELPPIGPTGGGVVAANPALHDALRALVLGARSAALERLERGRARD